MPGDNSIDVLTNDVAVVVISNDAGEVEVRCSFCCWKEQVTLSSCRRSFSCRPATRICSRWAGPRQSVVSCQLTLDVRRCGCLLR